MDAKTQEGLISMGKMLLQMFFEAMKMAQKSSEEIELEYNKERKLFMENTLDVFEVEIAEKEEGET
jgi:hypothetical protein